MNPISSPSAEFAIVVIGYNRLESIRRLSSSLLKANYLGDKVDLVFSIDNSGAPDVTDFANAFEWPFGQKVVIAHETRLGLKAHVLKCGDLTKLYENICVLEDDLMVSPGFYAFSKAATRHFGNCALIGGISLYTHKWNQYVNRPFTPIGDRFDVFFLQVASSWGQVWGRRSWQEFIDWLEGKDDADLYSNTLPLAVATWSSKSWLKFHCAFLVETGKYFVYPRQSLTTNFSDPGEHAIASTTYQVPLLLDVLNDYRFPEKLSDATCYDAFFENIKLADFLKLDPSELDVSLYGDRPSTKRYVLSADVRNFKIVKKFALRVRPADANVVLDIPGEGIFLYDTSCPEKNPRDKSRFEVERFFYEMRAGSKKRLLSAAIMVAKREFVRLLKKK